MVTLEIWPVIVVAVLILSADPVLAGPVAPVVPGEPAGPEDPVVPEHALRQLVRSAIRIACASARLKFGRTPFEQSIPHSPSRPTEQTTNR